MLYEAGVVMERKPFSIGARIEHLQTMIDAAQYGRYAGRAELGAADYKLAVHLANGRSAYTFCMCPGGEVVAAASEPGRVVTNGMSLFARNKENANAALLVGVNPEDFGGTHPLQGMFWQRELEAKAFELGGGNYHAPASWWAIFLPDVLRPKPERCGRLIVPGSNSPIWHGCFRLMLRRRCGRQFCRWIAS